MFFWFYQLETDLSLRQQHLLTRLANAVLYQRYLHDHISEPLIKTGFVFGLILLSRAGLGFV
ncbi:hypothetical protein [Pseudomonas sichuanensis]|uniref:Uncharacterized protein n=1 Tax=Pseudomonas sichuanensis TaxID=2213015 RepID=A0ABV0D9I0_9PSED